MGTILNKIIFNTLFFQCTYRTMNWEAVLTERPLVLQIASHRRIWRLIRTSAADEQLALIRELLGGLRGVGGQHTLLVILRLLLLLVQVK